MLHTRIENYGINPALYDGLMSWAQESKIKMPETVEFIGFLYETPEQRHPQETTEGWLVRISGSKHVPDGPYSVEVWEDQSPIRVFASAAKFVTGLPERVNPTGYYPSFGLNEVSLSSTTYDLMKPRALQKKLRACLRRAVAGFRYEFV